MRPKELDQKKSNSPESNVKSPFYGIRHGRSCLNMKYACAYQYFSILNMTFRYLTDYNTGENKIKNHIDEVIR